MRQDQDQPAPIPLRLEPRRKPTELQMEPKRTGPLIRYYAPAPIGGTVRRNLENTCGVQMLTITFHAAKPPGRTVKPTSPTLRALTSLPRTALAERRNPTGTDSPHQNTRDAPVTKHDFAHAVRALRSPRPNATGSTPHPAASRPHAGALRARPCRAGARFARPRGVRRWGADRAARTRAHPAHRSQQPRPPRKYTANPAGQGRNPRNPPRPPPASPRRASSSTA